MTCIHNWTIETPSGPTSWGVCQVCGQVREFKNSIPGDQSWFHSNTTDEEKELQVETLKSKRAYKSENIGLPYALEN
ncbi:hypothetical protein LCGC14_0378590 [marine sediment metagenome]|uniref:Uncharacterized protein n=1 Tax=marine sediment metagenome TaxID=412755 RepID=A0A0F9VQ82_9ZZZZ